MEVNLDALEARKALAPKYKETETRHDPYDPDIIRRMVTQGTISRVLKRKIECPADAYDHADALCLEWHQEDLLVEEMQELEQVLVKVENHLNELPDFEFAVPQVRVPHGTHKQQVEFARQQWKAAVQWRNQINERMEVHTKVAHDLYKSLRGVN